MPLNKKRNLLFCSAIGTVLEWYDFFLFGALSSIISARFFTGNHIPTLISSFGVFAVGFIARPFGSIFWGHIGDTFGRKKTLLYSMMIMTISTIGIGCLPSYETIGICAPIFLVILRIIQGFSVSGEHTGCLLILGESIELKNDAYLSLSLSCVYFGILLANITAFGCSFFLGEKLFSDWGWRIPFVLSLVLGFLGYYARLKIQETISFKKMIENNGISKIPFITLVKGNLLTILFGIGIFQLAVTIPYVVFIFLPSYVTNKLTLFSNSVNLMIVSILIIFFGTLSNKNNRTKIMLLSAVIITLFSVPILNGIQNEGLLYVFIVQLFFSVTCAAYVGSVGAYIVELFQTNTRYTGVAICLNFGSMLFGGSAPLILSILTYKNNNIGYVGYFLVISALIAISSLLSMRHQTKREAYTGRYTQFRTN